MRRRPQKPPEDLGYEVRRTPDGIIVTRGGRSFKIATQARNEGELQAAIRLGLAKLLQHAPRE